jgi:PAS domain S-box-containing protein
MHYQFPGFTIAYVVSATLCFLSAGMAWKRQVNPGTFPFALVMLSLAIWSFASIFEAGAMTVNEKIFWSKWQYLGITTISPLWLIFAAEYTGKSEFLARKTRWMIWVIPIATLLLVFTNELHGLIWTNVTMTSDVLHLGYYDHGIAFYVHMIFSYLCLLIGTIWLVKDFMAGQKKRRFQSVIFVIAVVISWAANILYILELSPIPGLDITPISFSLNALVLSWSILSYKLFDLVPVARNTLLGSMVEGVIVIDPNDIILEINPAAIDITGYKGMHPLGRSIWDVYSNYSEVIEQFRDKTNLNAEVEIPGDQSRIIDLQITSIDMEGENTSGQLIVLRDISKRKEAEKIEKDQRDFAEALADTAAVINSSLNINDVLEKILENVAKVVPHDGATINLVTDQGTAKFAAVKENVAKVVPHDGATINLVTDQGTAKFAAVKNSEKYGPMDFLLSLDVDVMEIKDFKRMSETRKAMIIADTYEDSDWVHNIEGSEWIRSYLGAPIVYQDKVLGFINLDVGNLSIWTLGYQISLNPSTPSN